MASIHDIRSFFARSSPVAQVSSRDEDNVSLPAASEPSAGVHTTGPPKDLSHHLSRSVRTREASQTKQFYKYFAIPGIGQLAGGLPNNYYFPFDTLEAKVANPSRWKPTPNRPIDPPADPEQARLALGNLSLVDAKNSPLNQPQSTLTVPHTSPQKDPLKKIDLSTALQYGTAQGYPPLYYFLRQLTREHLHLNCPYEGGPEIILTCGNTDGLNKVLQCFTNEWDEEKDWIRDREGLLCESFCYMNAVQGAQPRGLNIVPVAIDDEGMIAEGPGGLRDVLESWDESKGKRPHIMYTVTMGQNPTSGVLSLQRRREIYAISCQYDIIIVEDDPYWYLQFPTSTAMNTTGYATHPGADSFNPDVSLMANGEARPESWKSSGFAFLDSLVPSSLSIDTEGRVIRLDTFSKTVAPGCRLGWITAQPAFIERLVRITETSTQQPSGFVQSIVAELLLGPDHSGIAQEISAHKNKKGGEALVPTGEGWKADGWVRWLEGLRGNYERRMSTMCRILDEGRTLVKTGRRPSLTAKSGEVESEDEWAVVEKTPLYSFDWPVGGMFIWLHVLFENHPLYSAYSATAESKARFSLAHWVFLTSDPYKVLVAPGSMFSPTKEIREEEGWRYLRLCFAAIDEDQIADVSKRLADAIAAFFRIKDRRVIEKLLADADAAEAQGSTNGQAFDGSSLAFLSGPC